jgi:chromosome segregation ATPase
MKTAKIVLGLVVIGFLAGLVGGYTIWRPKDNAKADLRELVAKVGDAADRIEKRNKDLESQVEALKSNAREAEAMKAEIKALKGQLDNTVAELQGRIAGMDNQIGNLNDQLKQKRQEIAEKAAAQGRLQAELSAARQEAQQGEKLKAQTDVLQGRISALEKENLELRAVIDNISEMTKRKEAPSKRSGEP